MASLSVMHKSIKYNIYARLQGQYVLIYVHTNMYGAIGIRRLEMYILTCIGPFEL